MNVADRYNKTLFSKDEFFFLHNDMLKKGIGSKYKTYYVIKREQGFDLSLAEIKFVKTQFERSKK